MVLSVVEGSADRKEDGLFSMSHRYKAIITYFRSKNKPISPLQNKIVAFAFLLIVAVPVFFSLKFILEENLIQQEIEEKMESASLRSVSLPLADLIWVKNGKEVLIDGKFFDVKSFYIVNEQVTLTGFFDDAETELLLEYKNITDNNNPDNPLSELTFKFLFYPVFNNHAEIAWEADWHSISSRYHLFDERLLAAPGNTFSPPPRS